MTFMAYGIFSKKNSNSKRVAIRFGEYIFDAALLAKINVLDERLQDAFNSEFLNPLIETSESLRSSIKSKLISFAKSLTGNTYQGHKVAFNLNEIDLHLPVKVGGYTDFYASISHATNIGKLFRPDNPLMPNWKHLPVAYNGRASSIAVSGHPLIRPKGQILNSTTNAPEYKACQKLDFEVELGVVIGRKNNLGEPVNIKDAPSYAFGVCILNDWSARDIQSWEYQPLGPFNSKGFLSSISPWIIPMDELEQFKTPLAPQTPQPLPYLLHENDYLYDINFEVVLKTPQYPDGMVISRTNFKDMYWSINQWIAHHTVSGTSLNPGDFLGSGTISGFTEDSFGSLMELTKNGSAPLTLPNGEKRSFLLDGDELTIRAWAGNHELDLGEVTAKIYP